KAYFEEKRNQQSSTQYELAKNFDPNDPTPYFYDAIRKQTTNRPVEALHDMQKAIELNDNRGVYRSGLLLDSDAAARSAAQGRIYGDLGFQQLALVEGWKSTNTDPTNFSAHRLLADSYSILPRHEIARVSELLQSQLLQPLNMTPIQPHLAESNLFLVSAGGPAALSFNEFNPLFNRNGITFQTSGLAGEHHTYAGEGVLSGIYKNVAFSLGGFHFQTDGWRANADQKDTIASAFLQWEIAPQTMVQAEVRRREIEQGDLQQRFFLHQFSPNLRNMIDTWTIRLGGRHEFSPSSTVLGSFVYHERGVVQTEIDSFSSRESKIPLSAVGVEFQHLFRRDLFNLTSGMGYFDVDGDNRTNITSIFFPPIMSDFSLDRRHLNAYTYANIKLVKSLTLTGGLSFDHLWGSRAAVRDGKQSQLNPKVGVTWNPFAATSVRLAAARALKRTLIVDETLEPTQVAGFNQFFDDLNGTSAWRFGAAIDQKMTQDLFGGIEFSKRHLKIPVIFTDPIKVQTVDGREYLVRNYLFWTPHPWMAMRAEYAFERFDKGPDGFEDFSVTTHRIPLAINVFHPGGWSASLTGTYYHQSGSFLKSGSFHSGSDDFWTLDAAVNYRLPKRLGLITFGAANLADQQFKYFDTDRNNPRIQPRRTLFVKASFALP
ncbi:MAG TPA: TonB-dependent receptor, partial [Candidatus Binatia bacterium]